MSTAQRKAREWQTREDLLVRVALTLIETSGFNALSLDKVASCSDYSRGTVYNHFESREDLILELGLRALAEQSRWLRHACAFDGSRRHKVLAMHLSYQAFARHQPVLFQCLMSAKAPPVLARASAARLARKSELEAAITAHIDHLVQEALAHGELALHPALPAFAVSFGNWALGLGLAMLRAGAQPSPSVARVPETDTLTLMLVSALLDGLGWPAAPGEPTEPATLAAYLEAHLSALAGATHHSMRIHV